MDANFFGLESDAGQDESPSRDSTTAPREGGVMTEHGKIFKCTSELEESLLEKG